MNKEVTETAPADARTRRRQERVAWVAGTRGEMLLLGPLMREFRPARGVDAAIHFLFDTGEHGMAMQQTMDWLGMRADETAPLLHPADEASVRLQQVMERVEAFARQRKATHLVFTGYNATATACALLCHTRGSAGLWLRPADPAGVIDGLHLESGYRRIIRACAPQVTESEIEFLDMGMKAGQAELKGDIPGFRGGALVLIAVLRREWWAAPNITGALVQRVTEWARARPEIDWVFLSNLNARLERPVASVPDRPGNLLIAPPLPYPAFRTLLGRACGMLTDSPLFAAEAMELGMPLAVVGDVKVSESGSRRLLASEIGNCPADWLENCPKNMTIVQAGAEIRKSPSDAIAGFLEKNTKRFQL